jgi:serine/threonine protein kinase/WD40 repeat protein
MTDREVSAGDDEDLFDEILVEILEAEENGELPDPSEWCQRYPDFRAELEEFFADQSSFSRMRDVARSGLTPKFDGYEIERELGHGGCGIVYEARELEPPRSVALKALVGSPFLTVVERVRFRRESRVAARLDHENILPVYRTGTANGIPYFTMKLATGGPLSQSLGRYQSDPKAAAALVAKVARAMHFAHQHGVLHRDLKPSNILLDDRGEAFVSDFGLVRDLSDPDELTLTRELIGTIPYLAPERTSSRGASTVAVDVYGLGCILYACLTGRPPFEGASDTETLLKVQRDPPVPPARINSRVKRDLDAICQKCLEKEPARRYSSAADLAEDLDCFVNDLPTQAQPPGLARQLLGRVRRHPAITTFAFLALLFALAGVSAVLVHEARLSKINAELSSANSNLSATNVDLEQRNIDLAAERNLVLRREGELRTQTHADRLRHVAMLLEGFNRAEAIRVLEEILPEEKKQGGPSFAWSYLWREAQQEYLTLEIPDGAARSVAFSPDGKWLAVGTRNGVVRLFSVTSLKETRKLTGAFGDVCKLAFSPDSTLVVAVCEGPSPVIWNVRSGVRVAGMPSHSSAEDVAWGKQEKDVVTASQDGTSWIWRQGTLVDRRVRLCEAQEKIKRAAVFPDSRLVATTVDGNLFLTDLDTGLRSPMWTPGSVSRLARTPDGSLLILGSTGWIWIRNPLHPEWGVTVITGPGGSFMCGAAATTGYVAAGTSDGAIHLWDWKRPDTPVRIAAHTSTVHDVTFHPKGRVLVSAGADGKIRFWDVELIRRRQLPWPSTGELRSLAFDPSNPDYLVLGREDRIWVRRPGPSLTEGRSELFELDCMTGAPRQLAVSRDGSAIFAAMRGGPVVRYARKGLGIEWRSEFEPSTTGVGLSPDEKTIWSRHRDGKVRGRDAATGELIASWSASVDGDGPIAVHPNGKHLAVRSTRGRPHIRDALTGAVIQRLDGNGHGTEPLALSPDGRILAVVEGPTVVLWDWEAGKKLHELTDRGRTFSSLAFTPDGLELATGTENGSICVWRVSSGQRLLALQHEPHKVWTLTFHPGGNSLVASVAMPGLKSDLRIWWTTPIRRTAKS